MADWERRKAQDFAGWEKGWAVQKTDEPIINDLW